VVLHKSLLLAAKEKVGSAVTTYQNFFGPLIMAMSVQLLEYANKVHEDQRKTMQVLEYTKKIHEDQRKKEILNWLSTRDENTRHKMVSRSRVSGTGTWFVESETFRDWENGSSQVLVCPGHGM
jgi:hypothetical protein